MQNVKNHCLTFGPLQLILIAYVLGGCSDNFFKSKAKDSRIANSEIALLQTSTNSYSGSLDPNSKSVQT
ncbi:MAG: hypothetical protein NT027_02640, partial [Proteobacteria bacterium]|nr:hypothetical protein [Pseudomonadota bacterium]